MQVDLHQRGRASLDFLLDFEQVARPLMMDCRQELEKQGLNEETLAEDLDDRWRQIEDSLANSRSYRLFNHFVDFMSLANGRYCIEAFEEMRDDMEPVLKGLEAKGPATLDRNEGMQNPAWFDRYWIHRTQGGWDGHEYMGFIHSELIHGVLVEAAYGGKIFEARRAILDELPRDDYARILDMGAGSGRSTESLQQQFPNADIHANDLSLRMIEEAHRRANAKNWAWTLSRADAGHTAYPDSAFDLISAFAVFHEVPVQVTKDMIAEAFRLLAPGGDVIMTDVLRYNSLPKIDEWQFDYLAQRGGEPFWRASAQLDLGAIAKDAGFVDVVSERFGATAYWLLRGHKPE